MNEIATLFRRLNTGVYVIGVANGDQRNAFTASSLMQVSYKPLLVVLSVNPQNASYPILQASGAFTVSLLRKEQLPLARHFGTLSGREHDKLAGISWHASYCGAPILTEAAGFLECEVVSQTSAGDHQLFVARVVNGRLIDPAAEPMAYAQTGDLDGSSTLYPNTFRDDAAATSLVQAEQPQISFAPGAAFDAGTDCFVFFGRVDGEPIRCAVTQEALVGDLRVPSATACLPETFDTHRDSIHSAAARLIRENRWEPGGGILLRRGAFRRASE